MLSLSVTKMNCCDNDYDPSLFCCESVGGTTKPARHWLFTWLSANCFAVRAAQLLPHIDWQARHGQYVSQCSMKRRKMWQLTQNGRALGRGAPEHQSIGHPPSTWYTIIHGCGGWCERMVISDAAIHNPLRPHMNMLIWRALVSTKCCHIFPCASRFIQSLFRFANRNTCSPDGWPCELASYFLHRMARANF